MLFLFAKIPKKCESKNQKGTKNKKSVAVTGDYQYNVGFFPEKGSKTLHFYLNVSNRYNYQVSVS